jgi:exosortase/archaeosortase family protein
MAIYTLTILLFIKGTSMSVVRKAIVFVVGALGTFAVNVLRIVTIYTIGLGVGASAASHFHDYYGELFFVFWIVAYLSIIAFGPRVTTRISQKIRKTTSAPADRETHTSVSIWQVSYVLLFVLNTTTVSKFLRG